LGRSLGIGRSSPSLFGNLLSLKVRDEAANDNNSNNNDEEGSGSNDSFLVGNGNSSEVEGL
jgi:hypothetical protein